MSKNKKDEHEPHLEGTEVMLVLCNVLNNIYQQNSKVLHTFVSNKLFGHLSVISPTNFVFLKTLNSEFFLHWIMIYWPQF